MPNLKRPSDRATTGVPEPIWECKIGIRGQAALPKGADLPMRRAIQAAFREIVGVEAEFCFSGWSAEMTEGEVAVLDAHTESDPQ